MEPVVILLAVVSAGAIGVAAYLLVGRGRLIASAAAAEEGRRGADERRAAAQQDLEAATVHLHDTERRLAELGIENARLAESLRNAEAAHTESIAGERRLHARELAALQEAHARTETLIKEYDATIRQAFGKLAADALKSSSEQFLSLAQQKLAHASAEAASDMDKRREAVERLIKPIADTLHKTDEKLAAMEKERTTAYASLGEQVRAMQSEGAALRSETARLVKALREPHVRGRYGEIQLKRVAELAGMRSYCDFIEQDSAVGDDGRIKRPDMIVKLPNGRELVVDAKANLKPFLDAHEAPTPEEAEAHLERFAAGIAEQARRLSRKGYYAEYQGSAEITVMFVPGDQFVDAALSKRPDLLDFAAAHNVILASPSSLIALLRAVAVGFREARLAEEARELQELGKQFHERARVALEYVAKLGGALESAIRNYNSFVGSYESRLEPVLRKFEETGVKGAKELPIIEQVELTPKVIVLPDAGASLVRTDQEQAALSTKNLSRDA
jgi:DNA recombination protein RmuC